MDESYYDLKNDRLYFNFGEKIIAVHENRRLGPYLRRDSSWLKIVFI